MPNVDLDPQTNPLLCDGRYRLISLLGEGSTASVYRALDTHRNIERAIKILSPAFALHKDARTRFEREAATMARLQHPNIVEVYDYGADGDRFFLVMEVVDGGTLMEKLEREGPLSPRLATSLLQRTASALHYAHTQGVIHRDVKPHNVMLTRDGVPKVTDFGLARAMYFQADITIPGAVMGTWSYMAPEQRYDSRNVDTRTDIYAVGASMYAVLTGKDAAVLMKRESGDPLAGLPEALVSVIRKATQFQPEDRYQTAEALARDLAQAFQELPDEGGPATDVQIASPQEDAVPVAFKQFDHLQAVRDELSGPRSARKRTSRADARAAAQRQGASPAKAAAPAKPAGAAPPRSSTEMIVLGLGVGLILGGLALIGAWLALVLWA